MSLRLLRSMPSLLVSPNSPCYNVRTRKVTLEDNWEEIGK